MLIKLTSTRKNNLGVFFGIFLVSMLFVPPSIPFMVPDAFAQTPLTLILDPLPSTVQVGNTITFSGVLLTADQQYYIPNETIYIKDDVSFGSDIVMGTVTTSNEDGTFSGTISVALEATAESTTIEVKYPSVDEENWYYQVGFMPIIEDKKVISNSDNSYMLSQTKILLQRVLDQFALHLIENP